MQSGLNGAPHTTSDTALFFFTPGLAGSTVEETSCSLASDLPHTCRNNFCEKA